MDTHHHSATAQLGQRRRRKTKQKPVNPISAAIRTWLTDAVSVPSLAGELLDKSPKRWVVYRPLLLLPGGSFSAAPWTALLNSAPEAQAAALWCEILARVSKAHGGGSPLTHFAVNVSIPPRVSSEQHKESVGNQGSNGDENVLRSPSGLRLLQGDFGPEVPSSPSSPTPDDFARAFWVSTRQNGIYQTWAPRWTMFSRGNITEKARLLGFPRATGSQTFAVDLYAGIGYFVFSYARLGMRVLCWELNPWSVEGLRRGAVKNGWSVRVVGGYELSRDDVGLGEERIVVFPEDNREAPRRLASLRERGGGGLPVAHVNCGFLPTSEPTWRGALDIVCGDGDDEKGEEAWLHLHENVAAADIEPRRREIQGLCNGWLGASEAGRRAEVTHVELVKTFAPGVWHCVFDVHVRISSCYTSLDSI